MAPAIQSAPWLEKKIQVNRDLIAWARKRAGLTLEEASKKFNRIVAWEAGDASPTYPQLERLADKLKLPVAVFFSPSCRVFRGSGSRSAPCPMQNLT